MPKLRRQTIFVVEWIDGQDSIDHLEIFPTAAGAVEAADDGGDPARRDLVVLFTGYYAKRRRAGHVAGAPARLLAAQRAVEAADALRRGR